MEPGDVRYRTYRGKGTGVYTEVFVYTGASPTGRVTHWDVYDLRHPPGSGPPVGRARFSAREADALSRTVWSAYIRLIEALTDIVCHEPDDGPTRVVRVRTLVRGLESRDRLADAECHGYGDI